MGVVAEAVEAAILFLLDTVVAVGAVITNIWGIIYLFVFGYLAIQGRSLFLYLIPTMIVLAKPLVFLINLMLDYIVGFADVAILIFNAIGESLDEIESSIPGLDFGIHLPQFHQPLSWPPDQLTVAEFVDTLRDIGSTCPPFNSLGIIVEYLFTLAVGDRSCVLVRYIWPLPNLFTLAQGAFGWTYAGGAEPFVDTPGVNCEQAVTVGTHELICVGVGFGYLVLDLLLPLLIVGILINAYIPFLGTLLTVVTLVVAKAGNLVLGAARRVADVFEEA